MDREEAESKILQYGQLWQLYAEISVELKRKPETVTGKAQWQLARCMDRTSQISYDRLMR